MTVTARTFEVAINTVIADAADQYLDKILGAFRGDLSMSHIVQRALEIYLISQGALSDPNKD